MMNDFLFHRCKKIMNHLLKDHPVASLFKDPVDLEHYPEYKEHIKKPMDITTVRKKIKNKKYTHLSQWKDDVELIFSNAIQFNGRDSEYGIVASYLREVSRKLMKKYLVDMEQATKDCCILSEKLDRLLTPGKNQAPNLTPFVEAAKFRVKIPVSFGNDENESEGLTKLQEDLEILATDQNNAMELLYIIKEDDPERYEGKNDIEVNLETLKQTTIAELQDFISRKK